MQSAHCSNGFDPRPQIKMVSIAQQNLDTKFLEHILRNALDRTKRSHRHKHRRLDLSMRSDEFAGAGGAARSVNLQANSHRRILKELQRSEVRLQRWKPPRCTDFHLCNRTSDVSFRTDS